jgi:hypothetical protein
LSYGNEYIFDPARQGSGPSGFEVATRDRGRWQSDGSRRRFDLGLDALTELDSGALHFVVKLEAHSESGFHGKEPRRRVCTSFGGCPSSHSGSVLTWKGKWIKQEKTEGTENE